MKLLLNPGNWAPDPRAWGSNDLPIFQTLHACRTSDSAEVSWLIPLMIQNWFFPGFLCRHLLWQHRIEEGQPKVNSKLSCSSKLILIFSQGSLSFGMVIRCPVDLKDCLWLYKQQNRISFQFGAIFAPIFSPLALQSKYFLYQTQQ